MTKGAWKFIELLFVTIMLIINLSWWLDGDGIAFLVAAIVYGVWGVTVLIGLEST